MNKNRHAVPAIVLASLLLAACASQTNTAKSPPTDRRPVLAKDLCRSGDALVCAERRGKIFKCSCQSKDALRDLFDLQN